MAFTDHDVETYAQVRGARIPGLLERLPEADAEALLTLFRNTAITYVKLHEIIQDEAKNYPDLDPGWFTPALETVRKFAAKERKTALNGL